MLSAAGLAANPPHIVQLREWHTHLIDPMAFDQLDDCLPVGVFEFKAPACEFMLAEELPYPEVASLPCVGSSGARQGDGARPGVGKVAMGVVNILRALTAECKRRQPQQGELEEASRRERFHVKGLRAVTGSRSR